MAKNDVVLLDSFVEKASTQYGEKLDISELFELFAFDQILKDYDPTFEELESGWTDGGNDGGLDGFFIFVDGRAITPDVADYALKKFPEIDVHIFTVKHAATFEQQPLDSLISSLGELLDLGVKESKLSYPFNENVLAQRQLFTETYLALADRRPILRLNIHYCSRGDTFKLATNLKSRSETLVNTIQDLFSDIDPQVVFSGASELLNLARKQKDFTLRLPFVENYISREGNNYIILSTLETYYRFITDDEGHLRRYLFESNVRDYLGEVLINKDINKTLELDEDPSSGDFWWLNNGVTILGSAATVVGKELRIENVQIVNGLQTTETIYRHFSSLSEISDQRALLVKIVLAVDNETRARIIKATNYQNSVDMSSLRGLDKIQRDIEDFLADHGWFYDRRKNYFKNQGKPAERIISVPYLASAVRAIALGDPVRSQKKRSRQMRDDKVYRQIFNTSWDISVYLATIEITYAIEVALGTRKSTWNIAPIAFVHYIAYAYTAIRIGKAKYGPNEVAALAGRPPSEEEVHALRAELHEASSQFKSSAKSYKGIKLSKALIDDFVMKKVSS